MVHWKRHLGYLVVGCVFTFTHVYCLLAQEKEKIKGDTSSIQVEGGIHKGAPLKIDRTKIKIVPAAQSPGTQRASQNAQQSTTTGTPRIFLDTPHYDAGEVWESDELVHTFIVKNTGTAQLSIEKVSAG